MKLERRAEQVAVGRELHEVGEVRRHRLAVFGIQLGLGIEQIHVARPAVLEELNDRFGLRCEVWAGRAGTAPLSPRGRGAGGEGARLRTGLILRSRADKATPANPATERENNSRREINSSRRWAPAER